MNFLGVTFQEKEYISRPTTEGIALPSTLTEVDRIRIVMECSRGEICDEVELEIKGCVEGNYRYNVMYRSLLGWVMDCSCL